MPHSLEDISQQVTNLGTAWEQFKTANDQRLTEIEQKGAADPLLTEQVEKINASLDDYKSRLDEMETKQNRPPLGGGGNPANDDPAVLDHKAAFCSFLRKGDDDGLLELEKKAMSVASDPDGGYLVTTQLSSDITKKVFETSPIRQLASVETISTDSLDVMEDTDEAAAGWAGETQSRSDTDTPQLGKKNIPVHELYAQPKATQKLLDDASIDIEAWLAGKVSDIFIRTENAAFVTGNGVAKPRGILTYDAGTDWGQIEQLSSGSSGNVVADKLIELYYLLKEEYAMNATWLMNRATVQDVRVLKDGQNQYLWQPGLQSGAPDMLLGKPTAQGSDMPAPSANTLSVAFADFRRAYKVVDRIGVRVLRDPYTDKPFVKFYTTKRVGGDVVNFEAIKLMKLAA